MSQLTDDGGPQGMALAATGTRKGVVDGPAVLRASGVSLGFGRATVVEGVDVDVPRGSITALVGPSGSGKTTFLRSFNRMNDRVRGFWKKGSISLNGVDLYDSSVDLLELRRRVGMVFQRPNPFPMSIEHNVVSGVRAHRMAKRSQLRDIAETKLAEVGLWSAVADRLGDSPFRLSGGQQQLLCLARALAVEPEIILLDEPTSSLDRGRRGAAPKARSGDHHRHRHAQPRPGQAALGRHDLLLRGTDGGDRAHGRAVRLAGAPRDGPLLRRVGRLSRARGGAPPGTRSQVGKRASGPTRERST
jgi:ABC-type phosphate transport system ATPase subunit